MTRREQWEKQKRSRDLQQFFRSMQRTLVWGMSRGEDIAVHLVHHERPAITQGVKL